MKTDILNGRITSVLIKLALPIMGTSFLQMAYNLTDMLWIGRLGTNAVASVGTAGFFMWLSLSFIRMVQSGMEIRVSQNIGAQKFNLANKYVKAGIVLSIFFSIAYTIFLFAANDSLIGFFKIQDEKVVSDAVSYLNIIAIGTVFAFINPVLSGIYNAAGKTTIPFRVNLVGLVLNIILDPLFIFVFDMGVNGAAWATILSQGIALILLIIRLKYKTIPYACFCLKEKAQTEQMTDILKLGAPIAFQSGLFTVFAIILGRIVASFGPEAIAAQKVGVQVESITYMTAHGFASALSAFTGQNYGAGNSNRIVKGTVKAAYIMGSFGLLTSLILYFGAEVLFRVFISEQPTLNIGISYLEILAYSQLFMCLEITLSGVYMGMGKTIFPAVMSIVFTGLRIPAAYFLSQPQYLGLDGMSWTVSISSVFKGVIILFMVTFLIRGIRAHKDLKTV